MPIQGLLRSSITVGATALDLANNIGGVPFAGIAAALLGEIGRSCDQVKIHKAKCQLLLRRAQTILDGLRDGSTRLEGTALQQAADELEHILVEINRKMIQWSNYNLLRAFLKRDEIGSGIEAADQSLNDYLANFHIKAQFSIYERLHEAEEIGRRDQDETRAVLDNLVTSTDHLRRLLEMRLAGEPVAEDVMGAAQAELHAQPRDSLRYFEYQRNVYNLYRSTGVMPTIPDLSHEVVRTEGPVTGGIYSDVWLGTWLGNVKVALKSLRQVKVSSRAQTRFEHEIAVWHTLNHPHILPFLGIVNDIGPNIHVVSPWQSNGNAREYVKDRAVNRLKLLVGAARGVEYLHTRDKPVVHGNLRCANILVSDEGEAMISDFNLSRVIEDITETASSVTLTAAGGSSRWCAPELMSNGCNPLTKATDVYSFSMAILECLTSEHPFAHLRRDPPVVLAVVRGERPPRPAGNRWFTSELWELMERCWNEDPVCRPGMVDVADRLRDLGQEVSEA